MSTHVERMDTGFYIRGNVVTRGSVLSDRISDQYVQCPGFHREHERKSSKERKDHNHS